MKSIIVLLCFILTSCAVTVVEEVNLTPDVPVVLAARFTVTEQGRDEFLLLANATLEPTRKEPGCISYAFYNQPGDMNSFIYFEEWKSREALTKHLRKPYVEKLLNAFSGLLQGSADVRVYDINNLTYGLDDLLKKPQ